MQCLIRSFIRLIATAGVNFHLGLLDLANDCTVTDNDDAQWCNPKSNKDGQDKGSTRPFIRQVIKATAGQVTFRHVLSKAKERQGSDDRRIDPNVNDAQESPASTTGLSILLIQWPSYDTAPSTKTQSSLGIELQETWDSIANALVDVVSFSIASHDQLNYFVPGTLIATRKHQLPMRLFNFSHIYVGRDPICYSHVNLPFDGNSY